jgi:hypothetical protein
MELQIYPGTKLKVVSKCIVNYCLKIYHPLFFSLSWEEWSFTAMQQHAWISQQFSLPTICVIVWGIGADSKFSLLMSKKASGILGFKYYILLSFRDITISGSAGCLLCAAGEFNSQVKPKLLLILVGLIKAWVFSFSGSPHEHPSFCFAQVYTGVVISSWD